MKSGVAMSDVGAVRTFAGISCVRLCIALRNGATGALGEVKKHSYLALH